MNCKLCDARLTKIINGNLICPNPPSIQSKWFKIRSTHYIFVPKIPNPHHYIEEVIIDDILIQNFEFVKNHPINCRISDYASFQSSNGISYQLPFNLDLSKLKNLSEKEILNKINNYKLYL